MKNVLLLSGGMDSTTLLYFLKYNQYEVYTISFDYGQKHKKELEAAKKICKITNTHHKIVNITGIHSLIYNSSLTSDKKIPHGHYEDESMKDTVVPNRNMILLSIAIGYAVNIGANVVSYAAHSGDHAIYPDCRPLFFETINKVSKISNYQPVLVEAPFLYMTKSEIAQLGHELKVPFNLTWTCYEGKEEPCGKCGACIERQEAIESIKKKDVSYK